MTNTNKPEPTNTEQKKIQTKQSRKKCITQNESNQWLVRFECDVFVRITTFHFVVFFFVCASIVSISPIIADRLTPFYRMTRQMNKKRIATATTQQKTEKNEPQLINDKVSVTLLFTLSVWLYMISHSRAHTNLHILSQICRKIILNIFFRLLMLFLLEDVFPFHYTIHLYSHYLR